MREKLSLVGKKAPMRLRRITSSAGRNATWGQGLLDFALVVNWPPVRKIVS